MMLTVLALAALCAPVPRVQETDLRASLVALHEKRDEAGLAKLWREHPYEILITIDADLEGSLATWEQAPDKPDAAAIALQQQRALWGARTASEVTNEPIFLDYATAFVGWSDAQKKSFRAGQAACARARKASKEGDHAAAAAAGRECADLALPLGDWWGYAMGLSAEGQALAASGERERAIASLSQARLIYHDLGLAADELGCLRALAEVLHGAGRSQRALVAARAAIAAAKALGDTEREAQLTKLAIEIAASKSK